MVVYPAEFEDARGRARTEIHNDGSELALSLRGVEFVGSDFDALAPTAAHLDRARELFTLNAGELCACRLEWTMPLLVEGELDGRRQVEQATLSARLQLGTPTAKGALDALVLALELDSSFGVVRSSGRHGWFEDEMLDLNRALAPHAFIRACIGCAFSDYHPVGHGLFGGMACFRAARDEYRTVRDKQGLLDLWPRRSEWVQETHHCDEFEKRESGAGYRG